MIAIFLNAIHHIYGILDFISHFYDFTSQAIMCKYHIKSELSVLEVKMMKLLWMLLNFLYFDADHHIFF